MKQASGLNNARRTTQRWLAPIQPHLQHLAAASSAGTSLEANLKHITTTLATWDTLEEEMAELSMERYGHAKQLVVFFGAAGIDTEGGLDEQRDQPVRGLMWCPVVAPCKPPQVPCSSQAATKPAASKPGPSTLPPAMRSKRTKAEQAAEPSQPTKSTGKGKGKAAEAKPAPQPDKWLDRDCNAALSMERIGESRWRVLELCWWPDLPALPTKGKEYPGLGYKRMRDKLPKAQQRQQQQPAGAQRGLYGLMRDGCMLGVLTEEGVTSLDKFRNSALPDPAEPGKRIEGGPKTARARIKTIAKQTSRHKHDAGRAYPPPMGRLEDPSQPPIASGPTAWTLASRIGRAQSVFGLSCLVDQHEQQLDHRHLTACLVKLTKIIGVHASHHAKPSQQQTPATSAQAPTSKDHNSSSSSRGVHNPSAFHRDTGSRGIESSNEGHRSGSSSSSSSSETKQSRYSRDSGSSRQANLVGADLLQLEPLVRRLLARCAALEHAATSDTQALALAVWAACKLRQTRAPELQPLLRALALRSRQLDGHNLANIWVAMAGSRGLQLDGPILSALLAATQPSAMTRWDAQAVANTLWALARLDAQPSPGWWQEWFAATGPQLGGWDGVQHSQVMWALHRWYAATSTAMEKHAFRARDIANCAWAAAALGLQPPADWLRSLCRASAPTFNDQDAKGVCGLGFAVARMLGAVRRAAVPEDGPEAWIPHLSFYTSGRTSGSVQTGLEDLPGLDWQRGYLTASLRLMPSLSEEQVCEVLVAAWKLQLVPDPVWLTTARRAAWPWVVRCSAAHQAGVITASLLRRFREVEKAMQGLQDSSD
ncbi:hypothetical protein QJQ45_013624 [Haematococcus lacustris]|nr:hypothetical protein QJQ45_013624 [Haematococcus lacustris]